MDLSIIETYNGGDFKKLSKDLRVINGLSNMPYLALFGGNVRSSTPPQRISTEQSFDWWGNTLLMGEDPGQQFNSETERALLTTPLTSAGRRLIEAAVKSDFRFMRDFARVGVAVSIIATDTVMIGIQIQEPDNLQNREFIYIWDATRKELDEPEVSNGTVISGDYKGFNYSLDFSFS